jgi:hypothetical protein
MSTVKNRLIFCLHIGTLANTKRLIYHQSKDQYKGCRASEMFHFLPDLLLYKKIETEHLWSRETEHLADAGTVLKIGQLDTSVLLCNEPSIQSKCKDIQMRKLMKTFWMINRPGNPLPCQSMNL